MIRGIKKSRGSLREPVQESRSNKIYWFNGHCFLLRDIQIPRKNFSVGDVWTFQRSECLKCVISPFARRSLDSGQCPLDTLYDHSDSKETTSDSRASDVSGAFEHFKLFKKVFSFSSFFRFSLDLTTFWPAMTWHQLGPHSVSSFDFA